MDLLDTSKITNLQFCHCQSISEMVEFDHFMEMEGGYMFTNLHFDQFGNGLAVAEMEITKHIPPLHFTEMVEFDQFRNGLAVAELEIHTRLHFQPSPELAEIESTGYSWKTDNISVIVYSVSSFMIQKYKV